MLGKFLGRGQKSALPKNQIEVVCPVCGAAQHEPRLVVTTICRKCGEHLRIEKHRIVASSRINPVPSAIYPAEAESTSTPSTPPSSQAPSGSAPTALLPTHADDAGDAPALGLGNMMGFKDDEDRPRVKPTLNKLPPAEKWEPKPEGEATSASAPQPSVTATPAPPSSTFQKMREQGFRQQYFKEAECFDCHHRFKVGRSARTAQCPSCSAHICLEDIDVNVVSTTPIRTRGDVFIRKTGNVSTSEIKCRDLRVHGTVSGQIECTGELILRLSGTIIGEIRCAKLLVEKTSDVHFVNAVYADEVEIHARVSGAIQCNGSVAISSTGWIQGDVSARSVSIEPGGQLDGAMNILRPPSGANKFGQKAPPPAPIDPP